jgi:hypothetical protein
MTMVVVVRMLLLLLLLLICCCFVFDLRHLEALHNGNVPSKFFLLELPVI